MKHRLLFAVAIFIFFFQGLAVGIEFSAETYQKSPFGSAQEGWIYVGLGKFRIESSSGGQQIIRIVDHNQGKQWMLFPGTKSFMEQPVQGMMGLGQAEGEIDPCAGILKAQCINLGEEDLAGRKVIKWKMTLLREGKVETLTQWIDTKREIPLRAEMSNGRRMEMRMISLDVLDGRTVEKWESVVWGADKQAPIRSFQWYDSELNLVIREELPGGFLRELKNIKVGSQRDDLFLLPRGWRKVSGTVPGK